MGLMCLIVAHPLQCQSSLCLHPGSGLLLLCFYIASLWLQRFLWGGRGWVVFTPTSLCVLSQRPWRSRQIILLLLRFLLIHLVECDGSSKFVTSWIYFSESHFDSSYVCSEFWVLCRLRRWALYILVAMYVRVIPQ